MSENPSPERRRRISALFDEALELPPERREAFLDEACAEDAEMRRRVAEMLEAAKRSAGTIDEEPPPPTETVERTASPAESTTAIGPYRLLQRVGEGGMGEVWLAEQTEPIRRKVALKLIKAGMDTKQFVARFEAERQALALMDHPGIARVFDAGTTDRGLPYFVMEYVQGEPITAYCDRQRLTTRDRLELFAHVCEAVQHAHQKGIIHRDLKPSNVLVTIQGEKPVPKIIDFGVAKATAQRLTEKTMYTELGVLIGTPEYMSPEQAEMTGLDVDTRTDVYALGVILYEILTGALPFDPEELRAAGFDEIRRRIREVDPPRPSTRVSTLGDRATESARRRRTDPGKLVSRLKGDLDWITMKALEKDRTRRYGSPMDLALDIGRHLNDEPVLAGPPSTAYRTRKFVRRHRLGVAAAAVVVVALAGFGVTMAVQAGRIAKERNRAERVSEFLTDLFKVSDPGESRGNAITAREILDKGAERIEKELANEPEVQAELMRTMGRVYASLGLYPKAEPLLTRSVEIRRRLLGPKHPDTLQSMHSLAVLYELEARYGEAETLLAETAAMRRKVLGKEHPDTLWSLQYLAVVYERQGRFAEAEKLYREVTDARRRVLGSSHPDMLVSLDTLGAVYLNQGRYDEAEKYFREEVETRTRTQGEDHPQTLWAMNNLANVYLRQGRYDEAARLHGKTLEIRRRVLGKEHPRTLASMNNVANVYMDLGRKDEALKLYQEGLEISQRVLGKEHRNTISSMINVANVYFDGGRKDEAEKLYREALDISRRVLGKEHPDTLSVMYNLASVYLDRGDVEEAQEMFQETIEIGRRVLGAENPDTLNFMTGMAGVRAKQGRYDEAEKILRETLEIQRRVLGENQPDTVASIYSLGSVAALRGDRAKALDTLRQAVEHGYRDADSMAKDPDLNSLRGDPAFDALVAAARKNAGK